MAQIPPVAVFLTSKQIRFPALPSACLTPVAVRKLADPHSQVRKPGQDVLLILLERGPVFQHDTEHQACPILPACSAPDSDGEREAEAESVVAVLRKLHSNSESALGLSSFNKLVISCWRCSLSFAQGAWPGGTYRVLVSGAPVKNPGPEDQAGTWGSWATNSPISWEVGSSPVRQSDLRRVSQLYAHVPLAVS